MAMRVDRMLSSEVRFGKRNMAFKHFRRGMEKGVRKRISNWGCASMSEPYHDCQALRCQDARSLAGSKPLSLRAIHPSACRKSLKDSFRSTAESVIQRFKTCCDCLLEDHIQ